ncbi:hypothetical protein GCM10027022_02130 [Alpinimonas psychrophila]|uniref:Ig-like domain-containing protein n=1 Tax=Alpinimonas psychrophila TaxID=748908 RepID=A0A7W3JRX3_9MICO|nr:immunoglobulin domain-containing protein [Alpinimonas psychrophila]MBA8828022.1 hypothetical protein [Alpinimonas psychrophila]
MFSTKKIRLAAVAVVSIACVALAAGSASAVVQGNGSDSGLYLYDAVPALAASNAVWAWTSEAYGASSATDANAVITCSTGSTGVKTFIALAGDERIVANWKASAASAFMSGTKTVLSPNLSLASQVNGNAAAVKAAGGSYSLGVACTSNSGVTVTGAVYRTISVTASTGAWTATDAVVTDQFRFTTQPASQTVAVGSNVTFTAATSGTPAQLSIQWQKAESTATTTFADVAGATTGTLVVTSVTDADNGDVYRAVATNSAGNVNSSSAILTVSATTGSVGMSAGVVAAQDGALSLSVPANATVTFNTPTLVSNKSTATGAMPDITVNDARVSSRPGWSLSASVNDFSYLTNTISKSQLGFAPAKVSATAVATQAGVTQVAGAAVYPAVIATGTAANTVGNTVLNGVLTFVAPQEKPAGTYTSTMTLTLITN